jgi:succinate dehydrogenase hydrophobic anchor subunit
MATTKSRNLPLSKRGFNFETIMWFFTRLSALGIYAFVIVGVLGALIVSAQTGINLANLLRWAFLPNTTSGLFRDQPWIWALGKLMVTGFILLVSAHGVHGILEILDDYFSSPFMRRASRNAIIVFFLVANAIAIYVIWTSTFIGRR